MYFVSITISLIGFSNPTYNLNILLARVLHLALLIFPVDLIFRDIARDIAA